MALFFRTAQTPLIAAAALSSLLFFSGCKKEKNAPEDPATDEDANPPAPPVVPQPGPGPSPLPGPPLPVPAQVQINNWKPLVAGPNAEVSLSGTGFDHILSISVEGATVEDLKFPAPTSASFKVTGIKKTGPHKVAVKSKGPDDQAALRGSDTGFNLYLKAKDDGVPVYTGSAEDLCAGVKYYDNNGQPGTGKKSCTSVALPDCTGNGDSNCRTANNTVAVRADDLIPGSIKKGMVIGQVTGDYPSGASPLPSPSPAADGELAAGLGKQQSGEYGYFSATGDYKKLNIVQAAGGQKIVPGTTDQNFSGTETLFRPFKVAGDQNLRSPNIRSGTSIFGIDGILQGMPYDCSADNQTGCVAVEDYPSVVRANVRPDLISKNATIAGINGTIKFCRSGSNTKLFDNIAAPALAGLDPFDSIDDYNNYNLWPGETAFAKNELCTESDWEPVPADSKCLTANEDCIFRDKITGLLWSELSPAGISKTWNEAIIACKNLNFGGLNDWRLPTQKELLQAYVDGIAGLGIKYRYFGSMRVYHWAATTVSTPTGSPAEFSNTWIIDMSNSMSSTSKKSAQREYRCVR